MTVPRVGTMFANLRLHRPVLSTVGLYARTAYSVTQRTQEIGVPATLVADSKQVIWLFLTRGFFQLGLGRTIGIAAAIGVGKIVESSDLLVQTTGHDRSSSSRSRGCSRLTR
jgi:ABC-type antimicrobial peptide transport system permease subunit